MPLVERITLKTFHSGDLTVKILANNLGDSFTYDIDLYDSNILATTIECIDEDNAEKLYDLLHKQLGGEK